MNSKRRLTPMEIPANWRRVLRMWWAIVWRAALIACPLAFFTLFLVSIPLFTFFPQTSDFNAAAAMICATLMPLVASLIALKLVLGKPFGDYRLELTPYDADEMAKRLLPALNEIVIEGKVLSWNHPSRMEIAINGKPRYICHDVGMDAFAMFDLNGTKVAEILGKTVAGKFAYRLVTYGHGDQPSEVVLKTNSQSTPEFVAGINTIKINSYKTRQIVDPLNMKLTMKRSAFRAEALRSDASLLSETQLVTMLYYAHGPWRRAGGD